MVSYFLWHYGEGLADAIRSALRAFAGFASYFSLLELSQTLFSPWHRIAEAYGRGFDPNRFFSTLAGNLISRVLGAIVRSMVIVVGLVVSAGAFIGGVLFVAAWVAAPILIALFVLWGVFLFV